MYHTTRTFTHVAQRTLDQVPPLPFFRGHSCMTKRYIKQKAACRHLHMANLQRIWLWHHYSQPECAVQRQKKGICSLVRKFRLSQQAQLPPPLSSPPYGTILAFSSRSCINSTITSALSRQSFSGGGEHILLTLFLSGSQRAIYTYIYIYIYILSLAHRNYHYGVMPL